MTSLSGQDHSLILGLFTLVDETDCCCCVFLTSLFVGPSEYNIMGQRTTPESSLLSPYNDDDILSARLFVTVICWSGTII